MRREGGLVLRRQRAELAVSGGRNQRSGEGEKAGSEQWLFHYDDLSHGRIGLGASGDRTGLASDGAQEAKDRRRQGRYPEEALRVEGEGASYRWAGQCSRSSSRGVRRLEEEAEEASSRGMKSGDGEDRGHSSRVLSNMMSAIHDEPHQVGDDTEDDREENYAGSVVNSGRGRFRLIPGN
ncbi:hypothetical protein THAOC_15872 [Thalassiosira oceanica]|uniref:Uncharacterized protein n=1 Tax=Thalassiosira oceanica TaxID=159749 RepID=K0SEP1_THAOC|nr:hypothetical protein THAOC_15872 [Thalassiosira oceanica]|eukprot:EJK63464.1 hypothetical protein THAOC_15872 [Thalassiosira oceanica]